MLVYSDDHASHAIGAYGSRIGATPHLDRLAAGGMRFENSTVGNSICAPARATVLTGKHSHANGVIDNGAVFDGAQQTFPKLLRAAGYQTALIGKWHLKSDPTGFDHWEVLLGQGPYYNPRMKSPAGTRRHEGYTTDVIADLALEWLDGERDAERPFLLMVQNKAPHREWAPGPEHLTLYDDVEMPEPATLFDDGAGRSSAARNQEMTLERHFYPLDLKFVPPNGLTPEQLERWNAAYGPKNEAFETAGLEGDAVVRWRYQRYVKDYMRCIASVDDNVGRLLAALEEAGLAENTVVVYSSDQGFFLGDHGWYDKRWMYEESLRTPLIVRWPGAVAAGSVDRHLVQNIDLAPTFLELAGVPVPGDMHGESLVPLLRGEDPPDWRRSIYYHYYEFPGVHAVQRHYGVRTERYKLIRYYEIDEWELFDLAEDPDELTSVHDDPARADVRAELEAELARLQAQYGDTEPERSLADLRSEDAHRRAARVELQEVLRWSAGEPEPAQPGDPSAKPLTVGARCVPRGSDGVLVAQGGGSYGYSLYLDGGVPHFAVRDGEELFELATDRALDPEESVHLVGTLDAEGVLRLWVDGREEASAPGRVLSRRPSDPLNLGSDAESAVGRYEAPAEFAGELEEVRLYWGVLDANALRDWARP